MVGPYRHEHVGVLDLTWEVLGRLCHELVEKILAEYAPEVVVGVAKGGVVPGVVIASALRVNFFPIKLSRRDNEKRVRDQPQVLVPAGDYVRGQRVLLVDDMCVTRRTLVAAQAALEPFAPARVRYASLAVHEFSEMPDWFALKTNALILFPWEKGVFTNGGWQLIPEYQQELDRLSHG